MDDWGYHHFRKPPNTHCKSETLSRFVQPNKPLSSRHTPSSWMLEISAKRKTVLSRVDRENHISSVSEGIRSYRFELQIWCFEILTNTKHMSILPWRFLSLDLLGSMDFLLLEDKFGGFWKIGFLQGCRCGFKQATRCLTTEIRQTIPAKNDETGCHCYCQVMSSALWGKTWEGVSTVLFLGLEPSGLQWIGSHGFLPETCVGFPSFFPSWDMQNRGTLRA